MKKGSILSAIIVIAIVLTSSLTKAQTTENVAVMYLQMDDINVEKYQALVTKVKTQSAFAIKDVCIPAHVMSVSYTIGGNVENILAQFKSMAAPLGMVAIGLKTNFDEEQFMHQCMAARSAD